jgi:hypothetical protein
MAANPQKGEIEFTIGGKTYIFLLGTLGLARLEQASGGRPWPKIFADANRDGWGWHMMLTCFHCGLALHHPELSERDASILLDELTVPEFMRRLGDVWTIQFGRGDDDASRPLQAAPAISGNGTTSSVIG